MIGAFVSVRLQDLGLGQYGLDVGFGEILTRLRELRALLQGFLVRLERLVEVVGDPHRADQRDLDLCGISPGLFRARVDEPRRPADRGRVHADLDLDDVGERAGHA